MKKYLRASKRDDLLKEKAAWQSKHDARKQLYRDQYQNYRNARYEWSDNLVDLIKSQFSSYLAKLPDLRITVDAGWGRIEIRFNYEDRRSNENISLRWDYRITLEESGEIQKESNSWSGFNATTSEQVDDLMNSANFLRALVNFDWKDILNKAKAEQPQYEKYVGVKDPDYDPDYKDPGYDKMIKDATLDEVIGKDIWVKGSDGDVWYKILSATPAFYTYAKIDKWTIRNGPDYAIRRIENAADYSEKCRKDKLYVKTPVETITQDELIASVQEQ